MLLLLQNLGFGAYEKTAAAESSDGVTSQRKAQLMMGFEVNDKTEDEEIQELIEMNENLQHVESRDIQDYGQSAPRAYHVSLLPSLAPATSLFLLECLCTCVCSY